MRAGNYRGGPQPPRSTALYEAILRLGSLEECIRFFDDLCAVTELRTLEQRDPPGDRRFQRHREPREPHAELRPGPGGRKRTLRPGAPPPNRTRRPRPRGR